MLSESRNEIVRCQRQQSRLEQAALPFNYPPPIGGNPNFGSADSRSFVSRVTRQFLSPSSDLCPSHFCLLTASSALPHYSRDVLERDERGGVNVGDDFFEPVNLEVVDNKIDYLFLVL